MTETLQSSELEANLSESNLMGRVASTAGDAYKAGVNPIDYLDIQNGINPSGIDRSKISHTVLQVRDRLESLLSAAVLESGDLADGSISRATLASPEQVLDVAIEAYRSSLLAAQYEAIDSAADAEAI